MEDTVLGIALFLARSFWHEPMFKLSTEGGIAARFTILEGAGVRNFGAAHRMAFGGKSGGHVTGCSFLITVVSSLILWKERIGTCQAYLI
jgi:hypothetical protein